MIAEMIYTSAPSTLDGPGYGVVARSKDLPERLETFLRRLNRYDFDLPSEAGATARSPVVFSHTTLRDGAETWHVMSRIASGGRDYTGRAVFLAHHVAATGDEMQGASIADMIREPSLFRREWQGPPGYLPARPLPRPARRAADGKAWAALAGDREWSRVWVERWSRGAGESCFVIVPDGTDVMGLFADALALVPPDDAEDVTFITPLNADGDGVHFDWIGVEAGSKLALAIRRRFPGRMLDLTRPLGDVTPAAMGERRASPAGAGAHRTTDMRDPSGSARDDDLDERGKVEPRGRPKDGSAGRPPAPAAPPPPPPPRRRVARRNPVATILILSGIAAASGLGAMVGWLWFSRGIQEEGAESPRRIQEQRVVESGGGGPDDRHDASPDRSDGDRGHDSGRRGDQSPPDQPKVPDVLAETKSPRLVTLKEWLPVIVSDSKKWVELRDLRDLKIPGFAQLDLLNAAELGLKVAKKDEPGKPTIEVAIRPEDPKGAGSSGTVDLRLDGQKLVLRRSPKASDELIGRLQLTILQIDFLLVGRERVWVMFTPPMPALGFHDPKSTPPRWMGASSFFATAFQFREPLDAKLRVNGVGLSILPGKDIGGKFASPKEVPLGQELIQPVEVGLPKNRRWSATLHVKTQTPENRPAIVASLTPHAPPGADGDATNAEGEDEDPDSTAAAARPAGKPGDDRPGQTRPSRKAEEKNSRLGRTNLNQRKRSGGEELPKRVEEDPGRLKKSGDRVLLAELFRRYGLVRGAVVVTIKSGGGSRDVEILRFDGVPDGSPH